MKEDIPSYLRIKGKKVVSREEWGALPPKKALPLLKHPVRHIWYIYNTDSEPCRTTEECKKVVQDMQLKAMEKLADIPFNFLIGGDGKIYECRGWTSQPPKVRQCAEHDGLRIDVGYIGNLKRKELKLRMLRAAVDVISYGFKRKLLSENFVLREWARKGVPQKEGPEEDFPD